MNTKSNRTISSEEAIGILQQGNPLIKQNVVGVMHIQSTFERNWDKDIFINDCIFESFNCSTTIFENRVKITNSNFEYCSFYASYFLRGLVLNNCYFNNHLDFMCGGHNEIGKPIEITNNTFLGFVNFWDCWFTGEVSVSNNNFIKGTNIESKQLFMKFDTPPFILNNIGRTNINAQFIE